MSFAHQNSYFFSPETVRLTRTKPRLFPTQGQKACKHLSPHLSLWSPRTGENDSSTWAFSSHVSLPPLTSPSPRMLIYGGTGFGSKWWLCAWQVEPAAPVTLMISEVTLRPQRLLGRMASGILMRIPARPWPLKGGVFWGEVGKE